VILMTFAFIAYLPDGAKLTADTLDDARAAVALAMPGVDWDYESDDLVHEGERPSWTMFPAGADDDSLNVHIVETPAST
jgi:hypothetical protein